jgi:hypothetical protein
MHCLALTLLLAGAPDPTPLPSSADLLAPPRVASSTGGRVFVASAVAGGIEVVASKDAACKEFSAPVLALKRDDIMAGGRRGPRIGASAGEGPRTLLVVAITRRTKGASGWEGGDLLASRSTDEGATWSAPVRVGDVQGCAAEGLFDLAALGDGRFALVWIDVREKGARLCADFSADGAQWGEDVVAYASPAGSICECCAPAITAAQGGGAVVAFRNSLQGDRDIWTMLLDRGATHFGEARKSGQGSWKIVACPMAGPAADLIGGSVVAAWRRERNVFLASGDGPEKDLGEGTEPLLVAREDGAHVLWLAKGNLVELVPGRTEPDTIAPDVSFPCAIATESGTLVAWLDAKSKRGRVTVLR